MLDCPVPGLMEALNPREDESHGGTEEVPRGASRAGVRLAVDARRDPATRTSALRRIGEHLGIDPQTLRNGVTQAEIDSGPRLEAAEPERRRLTAAVESTVLAELAGPDAAQRWDSAPVTTRRNGRLVRRLPVTSASGP
jgi:transposase